MKWLIAIAARLLPQQGSMTYYSAKNRVLAMHIHVT